MPIETKRDMFDRELQKLYHAELEILDLHSDLAAATMSEEVGAVFSGHEEDTATQINRIETVFERLGQESRERGSPLMEGLLAEKDEFVGDVTDDELRELHVLGIGIINERIEITLLDRLLLLADDLDLPTAVSSALVRNREEAETALERMQMVLDGKRAV